MPTFTPGPWTVSDNHGKRYIEPVDDNEPVAIVCHGHKNSYSENANLIAAAPDLLLALERITSSYHALLGRTPVRDAAETLAEADAAIRKAKGERQ